MEGIDLKIDWFADFISGGSGVAGLISAIALIKMSIHLASLAEIKIALFRLDRTVEENTEAVQENSKQRAAKR